MKIFESVSSRYGTKDLGIDLGTSRVLVYMEEKGIVLNEPSVVALDTMTDKVTAVGESAKAMIGRTPKHIKTIRPMKSGAVAQYDITLRMLDYFIHKACGDMFFRPRVMISVPGCISDVERRAVKDAAIEAGARTVALIDESLAAATGAGIKTDKPEGRLVVDIGGGTTDVAVVSLGGVVISKTVKVAGNQFDEAVAEYVRNRYRVFIGDETAEQIKLKIGAVYEHKNAKTMKVRGRCLNEGLPREITLSSREMLRAMKDPIAKIIEAICGVVECAAPELIPDIVENGMTMTGGGSLLSGLDRLLTDVTGIKAFVAPDAPLCVAKGIGASLGGKFE